MCDLRHQRMRGRRREEELQNCQRRLEYLGTRLQDLAMELGDGRGAIWLKENTWFLNKPARFFDDVLFSVGKICNHLVSYMTFHKQKLTTHFPFTTYMGILYEVGDILAIVRDMLLVNPRENLSHKQSQIDLFWSDCTPFLFIFQNSNYRLLKEQQLHLYMQALLDLVPTVIQVGLCMYCTVEANLRGFDYFAETCLRLSRALVETGEFLVVADELESVITPFLRQWILYALELVQNGVKVRTEEIMSPRLTHFMNYTRDIAVPDEDTTVLKTIKALSLSSESSIPDEVAEATLAPLKLFHGCLVRASCQPFKWIEIARARIIQLPVEKRKGFLEEIGLRENQKLISDIFIFDDQIPSSWRGVRIHCPLTKSYDELKMRLFIKVKRGDTWADKEARYEHLHGKGNFLTFAGCPMEGFVAIEECPLVTKEFDQDGGSMATEYDEQVEVTIPKSTHPGRRRVKMMVQAPDRPRERQYRDYCPDDFRFIRSTSNAIEIDGANVGEDGNIAIKIPFDMIMEARTKILVLRYNNEDIEIREGDEAVRSSVNNCYTVNSKQGGTVLAAVDRDFSADNGPTIKNEMDVLFGKKQLCKILLFVENQNCETTESINRDEVVFCIVLVEKYGIPEVLRDKSKVGLIELPNSQSADRLLKQTEDISLQVRGAVELDPDIPEDAYSLTYLVGSDNFLRFPVRLTDPTGRITFVLRRADNSVLHTHFLSAQELLSLIAKGSCSPGSTPSPETDEVFDFDEVKTKSDIVEQGKEKETEVIKEKSPPALQRMSTSSEIMRDAETPVDRSHEASLKILNRNSLVNLAKYLSKEEGHRLGHYLDMRQVKVDQIFRTYRHSVPLASFHLLYEWRGRKGQANMADKLISALRDADRRDLSNVLIKVRQKNRDLALEDFEGIPQRRTSRR